MKNMGSAYNSLSALYVGKRPTHAKFTNNKISLKNSFPRKGKEPHTFFDRRNMIKTTKYYFYL
jgi:hypothetical protein